MRLRFILSLVFPLLAWSEPTAAQAVYFTEGDTLDITLDELRRGRENRLRGAGRTYVRVQVRSAAALPLGRVARLQTSSSVLQDSLVLRLHLADDTASIAAGTYAGTIEVRDSTGQRVLGQQLVRVAVPAHPPAATAIAPTWTAEIYKGAPIPGWRTALFPNAASRCAPRDQPPPDTTLRGFRVFSRWVGRQMHSVVDRCVRDNIIPLAVVDSPSLRVEGRTVLGVLTDSAGDHGLVWWTGRGSVRAAPESVRSAGMQLEFASFDHPAIYTGAIDLTPGVPGGVVKLTVKVSHAMLWPFIAIFVGVVLSYALRRYLQARRGILDLKARSAELQADFSHAAEEFGRRVAAVPGAAAYRIEVDMMRGFAEADERIRGLDRVPGTLQAGNAAYDEVVKRLDALEEAVDGWRALADSLAALHDALQAARADAAAALHHRMMAPYGTPELVDQAARLLKGKTLRREALAKQRHQVDATIAGLERWSTLNQEALEDVQALGRIQVHALPHLTERHQEASRALRGAWATLWRAEDDAQLTSASTSLREARALLAALQQDRPLRQPAASPTASATMAAVADGQAAPPLGRTVPLPGLRIPFRDSRQWKPTPLALDANARRAKRRRDRYGIGYLVLTVVVATLTGLNELYLDGPYFGTMQDYVLAVLWGFSTKLGLDVVRDTLETRRVPWPAFLTPGGRAAAGGEAQPPTNVQTPGAMGGQAQGGQVQGGQVQGGQVRGGGQAVNNIVPDDKPATMPQGEGDPETDGEQAPPAQKPGERVKSPEELAAAG